MIGVIFVISGCVLDYVVKIKHWQECKSNSNATKEWKKKHEKTCCINYVGSSGAMETDVAVEMFLNSIDMHNLKYTSYVGDGDSSSFGCVSEALEKKMGVITTLKRKTV